MKENTESLTSSKADEKPVNGSLQYVLYRDMIRLSASGAYHLYGRVGKLVTPSDCKSDAYSTAGSSPACPTTADSAAKIALCHNSDGKPLEGSGLRKKSHPAVE